MLICSNLTQPIIVYIRVILHKMTTLVLLHFIDHKKMFQIVAVYKQPKTSANNQKLQPGPGCLWDKIYYFKFKHCSCTSIWDQSTLFPNFLTRPLGNTLHHVAHALVKID